MLKVSDKAISELLKEIENELKSEILNLEEELKKQEKEEKASQCLNFGQALDAILQGKATRIARRSMPRGMYLYMAASKKNVYPFLSKVVYFDGHPEEFIYSFPSTDITASDWYIL